MLLQQGRPGESYNFGGDSERTNLQVVEAVCAVLDDINPAELPRRELISFVEDRPGHDLRYAMDTSKVRGELGWSPSRTFEEGLRDTVAWYVAHRGWWQPIRERVYAGRRLGLAQ
jgi:dTDP-glucose 4,6-dehydratase